MVKFKVRRIQGVAARIIGVEIVIITASLHSRWHRGTIQCRGTMELESFNASPIDATRAARRAMSAKLRKEASFWEYVKYISRRAQ